MSGAGVGGLRHAGCFKAVVIGGSAGGLEALRAILAALPAEFALPVLVVQHLHPDDHGGFARHLATFSRCRVIEPCDKEAVMPGRVYTAPANYHMLVERDATISLSVDAKVNYSRPSIDVLFESAAGVWGAALVAVILSGASADGARGMQAIQAAGGLTVAQDPGQAPYPLMPQAAIDTRAVQKVMPAKEIGRWLQELDAGRRAQPPSDEIRVGA